MKKEEIKNCVTDEFIVINKTKNETYYVNSFKEMLDIIGVSQARWNYTYSGCYDSFKYGGDNWEVIKKICNKKSKYENYKFYNNTEVFLTIDDIINLEKKWVHIKTIYPDINNRDCIIQYTVKFNNINIYFEVNINSEIIKINLHN